MREYVVDGLPGVGVQYSNFLRRNIRNGSVVSADPAKAEGVPWLKEKGDPSIGRPAPPPAAEFFEGLSNAAAKVVKRLDLTPTEALRLGVKGLMGLEVSKTSAMAIVKAAEGNE